MRVSKGTIIVLVSMLLISIFLANVVNLLSTEGMSQKTPTRAKFLRITDSSDHLLWFLQVIAPPFEHLKPHFLDLRLTHKRFPRPFPHHRLKKFLLAHSGRDTTPSGYSFGGLNRRENCRQYWVPAVREGVAILQECTERVSGAAENRLAGY